MNDLIIGKVSTALKGHWANPDLVSRLAVSSLSAFIRSASSPLVSFAETRGREGEAHLQSSCPTKIFPGQSQPQREEK